MQIKHDYYPFSLVLSPTFGQLGRPLFEETFFTLHIQQCNSLLEDSFNMFLPYVFQTPLEFLFLFWCGLTKILRLLSSVTSDNILSFQMSKFCLGILPRHMPNTNVLT